ncbi:MAG: DNA-directed RNA polymerase subunit omega [Lachnospiraceae bacterium]|jgi:DNA-directed RNA polymerase subunit omega|nr:DNA-directed RNA polymerase subunit omega [Lachnospiraceae bacterium]
MIHPSYVELMNVINKDVEEGDAPIVNSRYSVVCATAKRARQIIDGSPRLGDESSKTKPLSTAVNELYSGKLRILTDEEAQLESEEEEIEIETAETENFISEESEE